MNVLLFLVTWAHAKDSMDKGVDKLTDRHLTHRLVDRLLDRRLQASLLQRADLDSMTIGKPGQTALPHRTSLSAFLRSPVSSRQSSSSSPHLAHPTHSDVRAGYRQQLHSDTCSCGRNAQVAGAAAVAAADVSESGADFALLFDCDGVIVETEELHRLAYNKAFEAFGLQLPDGTPVVWDVPYYDKLQNTIGGGKPKMNYYFNNDAKVWPESTKSNPPRAIPQTDEEKVKLVDDLQDCKTECYKEIVSGVATARPGVLELMDAAIADPKLKVGICSAATKGGFEKILEAIVGKERASKLDVIIAGDDVKNKKPDPEIYNTAQGIIGVPNDQCIVIEDSTVGLKAAKCAGMRCIVTYTENTASADFYGLGADATVPDLSRVTLKDIFDPLRAGEKELIKDLRDPH